MNMLINTRITYFANWLQDYARSLPHYVIEWKKDKSRPADGLFFQDARLESHGLRTQVEIPGYYQKDGQIVPLDGVIRFDIAPLADERIKVTADCDAIAIEHFRRLLVKLAADFPDTHELIKQYLADLAETLDARPADLSASDGRQRALELPPDRTTRIYPHTREEFTSLLHNFTREYFGVDGNRQPQFSGVRLEREAGQWLIRNSQRLDLIVVEVSPIKNNSSVDVAAWPMKWETTAQTTVIQAAFEAMLKYLDERITPTIDTQLAEKSTSASDAKLDQLLTGQDELKRGQADLQRGQAAIYQRLNQAQREIVDEVLAGARAIRVDDVQTLSEMRGMLDGLRRALIDLRARELPQMSAGLRQSLDEVTEVLKADADVNTGLELTIPLIPLLLDYKLNLDLGGGLDLRQWWENLLRKLHRGN
jgi:hypothetical protein